MASIAANRNIWQKKNIKTNKQTKISSFRKYNERTAKRKK